MTSSIGKILRSNTTRISVALLLLFTAGFLGLTGSHREHAAATPGSGPDQPSLLESNLPALPKEHERPPRHDEAAPAQAEIPTYETFKREQWCANNREDVASLRESIISLQTYIARQPPREWPPFEAAIKQKEEQIAGMAKCLGRKPLSQGDLSNLLAAAAKSGDKAAQLAYATDPGIDVLHAISYIAQLREWRDHALGYVNEGVDAGNAEAMLLLAGAADPFHCNASGDIGCSEMLSKIVAENPAQSYEYYYLTQLTSGASSPQWISQELDELSALLAPGEVAAAKARAETKHQQIAKY